MHEGHELAMLLRKAYLSFHRRTNSWMLDHGVTADQFVLLTVVAREPGITQISIVERTSSDPNTVAAVLKRLEQRRLVRREAHGRDRRVRCVFLTAEGQRLQGARRKIRSRFSRPCRTAWRMATAGRSSASSSVSIVPFPRRPPQRRGTT